jgi:hypothetical protein
LRLPQAQAKQGVTMSDQNLPGIYLIVEFDWPNPFIPDVGKKARRLHDVVQNQPWIQEIVAGSGGLGEGLGSIWIFRLENYAALDRLLRDRSDEVSKAYLDFFSAMPRVKDKIREEVMFL